MPAPSPINGSAPTAPRWVKLIKIFRPDATMSWVAVLSILAIMPRPQASCSFWGSYSPTGLGAAICCFGGIYPHVTQSLVILFGHKPLLKVILISREGTKFGSGVHVQCVMNRIHNAPFATSAIFPKMGDGDRFLICFSRPIEPIIGSPPECYTLLMTQKYKAVA